MGNYGEHQVFKFLLCSLFCRALQGMTSTCNIIREVLQAQETHFMKDLLSPFLVCCKEGINLTMRLITWFTYFLPLCSFCPHPHTDRTCHSGVLGPAPLPTADGWIFSNFVSRMFNRGSLKSSVVRVFDHENQDTPKSQFTSTCCPGLPYFENLFPSHPQCFGWIHAQLWCCGHDTEPTAGPQDREGQTSLFFLELCCANSPS